MGEHYALCVKTPALSRLCRYMETKTSRLVRAFICPTSRPMNRSDDPEEYEHAQEDFKAASSAKKPTERQAIPKRSEEDRRAHQAVRLANTMRLQELLLGHGKFNVKGLADKLEVSEKTVTATWTCWRLLACPGFTIGMRSAIESGRGSSSRSVTSVPMNYSGTMISFKIELLKAALNTKPLLIDVPDNDLRSVVEIIHHIGLRDTLHIVELKTYDAQNEAGIKLFGINPLFSVNGHQEPSLLEKLGHNGFICIKNIHFLHKDSQERLAEYLRYGYLEC